MTCSDDALATYENFNFDQCQYACDTESLCAFFITCENSSDCPCSLFTTCSPIPSKTDNSLNIKITCAADLPPLVWQRNYPDPSQNPTFEEPTFFPSITNPSLFPLSSGPSVQPSLRPSIDLNCEVKSEFECLSSTVCGFDFQSNSCTLCLDLSMQDCNRSGCHWQNSACVGSCHRRNRFGLSRDFSQIQAESPYHCEAACMSGIECVAATYSKQV